MNTFRSVIVSLGLLLASQTSAQIPTQIERAQDVTRGRIGEQRVQRQTEILRLEQIIDRLGDRLTRIERSVLFNPQFPAITITESTANLRFAQAQKEAGQARQTEGPESELANAKHELAVIQATGQLEVAKAAHEERLLLLELDVLRANRRLLVATQESEQLERLVARGYVSSEGLKMKQLDQQVAEKEVQLARLRLAAQQKLNTPPSDDASE